MPAVLHPLMGVFMALNGIAIILPLLGRNHWDEYVLTLVIDSINSPYFVMKGNNWTKTMVGPSGLHRDGPENVMVGDK